MSHTRGSSTDNAKGSDELVVRRRRQHGQAAVELAIFGSLLLLCLSILVRMGLSFQYRQEAQQRAFRRSLAGAFLTSSQATHVLVRDRRIPDPQDALGLATHTRFVANSSTFWASVPSGESVTDFQINGFGSNGELEFKNGDLRDDANPRRRLGLTGKSESDITTTAALTRAETPADITNTLDTAQTETIKTIIKTTSRNIPVTQTFERHKTQIWETGHAP